jgi:membrane fusion protein (multidrug efflux system)
MLIQKLRLAAVLLAAGIGVVFAGGVVLRARPGDPPPAPPPGVGTAAKEPGGGAAQDKGKSAPADRVDEVARKEIEDLRKRVETLERKLGTPAPERQKVVVSTPQARDVAAAQRYVGKVAAHRHISVSALVGGVVEEVLVREGQAVRQGDVLVRVLPILYKARLDAELAEARIAQLETNNVKRLFEQKVVSQQELALAEAKLAKMQARVKLAEAELNFTAVRAPFDGLVGRLQRQPGSLVKEGEALFTLSDNSTVWVYFNVPEARYLDYMADRDRVKAGTPVELVLANGRAYPQAGKLAAIEARFNDETGTIPFRADFPNPDRLLRHGQTGTVVLHETLKGAVVIPQRAAFEDGGRWYVFVVGPGDVARRREVMVRAEADDGFVVGTGLGVADRVVVDGVRQVRDGERVEYEFRAPGGVASPKAP